jgi:hypothetical protein
MSSTTTNEPAPFDDPKADITLRSCDGVHFRTYKLLLSLASPIFGGMFSIPQPAPLDGDQSELPIVNLTETSTTIRNLLSFCYPPSVDFRHAKETENLSEIADLIEAAMKYEMSGAQTAALQRLVQPRYLDAEPLRVFVIACRFKAEKEARLAAKYLLRRPWLRCDYFAELELVNAATLFRVELYHRQCTKAASRFTSDYTWIKDGQYTFVNCDEVKPNEKIAFLARDSQAGGCIRARAHDWWWNFMEAAREVLTEAIDTDAITDREQLIAVALEAADCDHCRPRVAEDLAAFIDACKQEIEDEVSKVRRIGNPVQSAS